MKEKRTTTNSRGMKIENGTKLSGHKSKTIKMKLNKCQIEIGSVDLVLKLEILNLLPLVTIRPPLFFPLELEVRPVVVLGLLTGQHYPGFHQDTEEESFLNCLRSPDNAAIQCVW